MAAGIRDSRTTVRRGLVAADGAIVRRAKLAAWVLALVPALAGAWFDDDWPSRKQLIVDAGLTGADIQETLSDVPLLVRLHAGNFRFFQELAPDGADLRFVESDVAAAKHHAELLDAGSELGLLWVKLPRVRGGDITDDLWLYYGNHSAADAADPAGTYDPPQGLVFHFREGQALPQDATANANHAAKSRAAPESHGWIGAAARFDGTGPIEVPAAPSLGIDGGSGWTFSAWVRLEPAQQAATLLRAQAGDAVIELSLAGNALSGRIQQRPPGGTAALPPVDLPSGEWAHVALVVRSDRLEVYVDGAKARSAAVAVAPMTPSILLGGDGGGRNFSGLLDEVQIARAARSSDWLKFAYRSQSPDYTVLNFGDDQSGEGAEAGYFRVILQNVTTDGWVIIGLTGLLGLMSVWVTLAKLWLLARVGRQNARFLIAYTAAGASPTAMPVGDAGKPTHSDATLGRLCRVAAAALAQRGPRLGADTLNVLRARLDATIRREVQRLNRHLVLLTLSISGGPFLGLLGTVVGVMITFASIAESGDININAIAPGVAAAMAATCAGLAVAIPALFAYNYLITRIKEIVADTEIFRDELLADLIEHGAGPGEAPES